MIPELKLTTCKTDPNTCSAVGDDGHPVFKNPNNWTKEEMNSFYAEHLQPQSMAFNIKWMGLAHYMKAYTYEEAKEISEL